MIAPFSLTKIDKEYIMNQNESHQDTKFLLSGGYDLHTHTIPSHVSRSLDDFELIEQATRAGMKGVMIKCHYEPTGARAALVNRRMPAGSAKAFGAIPLNHPVGGINPYAVHSALKMGASMVFMPTRDAENCLLSGDMPGDFFRRPGISLLDEFGSLKPEVYDVMDVVKEYDAALATRHISTEESVKLCVEGRRRGVRMVLTHPEWDRTTVSPEIQKSLAQMGVWVEKCWYNVGEGNCSIEEMASHIRIVGAEHCFLSTDRGQAGRETPVEGMSCFISQLLRQGITTDEIHTMLCVVPEYVLGIQK